MHHGNPGPGASQLAAMDESAQQVVPVTSLREFFRDALHGVLQKQHLCVADHTEHYVVNVLTLFARSEALYGATPDRSRLVPLTVLLCEALQAPDEAQRNSALQHLGDVSLFIAGFFARGFSASLVDIDYHIAMGGQAYGALAHSRSSRVPASVFAELAAKFQHLVDVLNELRDGACRYSDADILRLYEIWLRTGSQRSRALLARLGVLPTRAGGTACAH
ncbi:MAG: hypothetical protein JSR67_01930 [Proteobacteria bacterium]|nr:hypothetical protein [Pseudomonadota bacterium]